MRWSLILSTFIAVLSTQSLLSFALVTTQNGVALEKRVLGIGKGKKKDIKASSSTYRTNSFSHPYAYEFGSDGVTRQSLPKDQRQGFFSKMFKGKKYDADHIYEAQLYHETLRQQGTSHAQLPPALQAEASEIMNGPGNMAAVPPDHNRRKGQWTKQGIKKKAPRRGNELTRSYSLSSYPQAVDTAERLQDRFRAHGYGQQGPTFHNTLHDTMTHAGVLTPGQASPRNSPPRHSPPRHAQSVSYHTGPPPVIPQVHRSQSSRQRTPSVSRPPPQMHHSQSTRQRTPSMSSYVQPQLHHSQSTRQRTPSMSSYVQPQLHHSQSTRQRTPSMSSYVQPQPMNIHQQYAHATGSYAHQPVYQNPHAHSSTPYISQHYYPYHPH